MGIVNVTPDSFSDGGRFLETKAAVDHALRLAEEGADLLDIGGESTRPGAEPVTEAEEKRRVLPVIEALARQLHLPLSIDTMKPGVARDALSAGATIVNDVGAARTTPSPMTDVVAANQAGYICMHMQGTPRTMQSQPTYTNVLTDIYQFFSSRLANLQTSGVNPEQVVLDVGIGFGKTLDHNLQLLAGLERFKRLERPMLVGASRKSFIGKLFGAEVQDRLAGSIACACWAALHGAQLVRVHDVAETVQAIRLTEAIARHSSPWTGNS